MCSEDNLNKERMLFEIIQLSLLLALTIVNDDGLRSAFIVALRKTEDALGLPHSYPRRGRRHA